MTHGHACDGFADVPAHSARHATGPAPAQTQDAVRYYAGSRLDACWTTASVGATSTGRHQGHTPTSMRSTSGRFAPTSREASTRRYHSTCAAPTGSTSRTPASTSCCRSRCCRSCPTTTRNCRDPPRASPGRQDVLNGVCEGRRQGVRHRGCRSLSPVPRAAQGGGTRSVAIYGAGRDTHAAAMRSTYDFSALPERLACAWTGCRSSDSISTRASRSGT